MGLGALEIEFQNRKVELEIVRHVVQTTDEQNRCCILCAHPASGLTSFFRHAAVTLATENCLTVYSKSLKMGPSQLFESFFYSLQSQMKPLSRKIERPEAFRKFVGDTVGGSLSFLIPGGGLLKPTTEIFFERIRSSYYSSTAAERFSQLVTGHLASKTILFLIDNAQYITADDLDLFRETVGRDYSNVRYILGYVDRPSAAIGLEDLADRIRSVGQDVVIQGFQPPDALLAEDILAAAGLPVSPEVASALAVENDRNAHKIIARVRGIHAESRGQEMAGFSQGTLGVLRFLVAAEQPLPLSLLARAIESDPTIVTRQEDTLEKLIEPLIATSSVVWKKHSGAKVAVELNTDSNPVLEQLRGEKIAILSAQNILYRTAVELEESHPQAEEYLLSLRFNLARDVDPTRAERFALALVERAIRSGSLQTAQRFSENLPLPKAATDLTSFLVTVALLIATKNYSEALTALDKAPIPSWKESFSTRVFYAICLDRTRAHGRAIAVIGNLLNEDLVPEVASVLGAVKMASLLHLGNGGTARASVSSIRKRAAGAKNFGYFLRNAAAAFDGESAIEVLNEAVSVCEANGDDYAASTCRANLGSIYANSEKFDLARSAFEEASRGLSRFGFVHMEEVLCNLAYLDILEKNTEAARLRLEDLKSYARPDMPKLYAFNHMALLMAVQGRADEACAALDDAEELSSKVAVPVARLRHRLNSALIRRALQREGPSKVPLEAALASAPGDLSRLANNIATKIEAVWPEIGPSGLLAAYSPGFLEYWSFDALFLLPGSLLPSVTMGQDM